MVLNFVKYFESNLERIFLQKLSLSIHVTNAMDNISFTINKSNLSNRTEINLFALPLKKV